MPMVRCESAAGRFPTPRVPGANMGDLYHIDADGLQAYPRCESWNCCRFSLHCHLTAGDTLFDIMKASFRSSLLSAYYNSVTESSWMLWNDLFQGLVYRGIFFSRPPSTSGTAIIAKFHPPSVAPWTDVILTK